MSDPTLTRVGVYIDFDNIVISRYNQIHSRGQFQSDQVRAFGRSEGRPPLTLRTGSPGHGRPRGGPRLRVVLRHARLTRAYADWSVPINADYRGQLVSRAVDLVQLFPAAAYAKNGADIRLAVDAVEDCSAFRSHPRGDRRRRLRLHRPGPALPALGRYVVGIGVAGSPAGPSPRPATSS